MDDPRSSKCYDGEHEKCTHHRCACRCHDAPAAAPEPAVRVAHWGGSSVSTHPLECRCGSCVPLAHVPDGVIRLLYRPGGLLAHYAPPAQSGR